MSESIPPGQLNLPVLEHRIPPPNGTSSEIRETVIAASLEVLHHEQEALLQHRQALALQISRAVAARRESGISDSRLVVAQRQLEMMTMRVEKERIRFEISSKEQLTMALAPPSKKQYFQLSDEQRKTILDIHVAKPSLTAVDIGDMLHIPYHSVARTVKSGKETALSRGGRRVESVKFDENVVSAIVAIAIFHSTWTMNQIQTEYKIIGETMLHKIPPFPIPSHAWISTVLANSQLTLKVARPLPVQRNSMENRESRLHYAANMLPDENYDNLIFIDEAGFHSSHRRAVSRAFVGCEAFVDTEISRGANITVIGAICAHWHGMFWVKTGSTNQESFRYFLNQVVADCPIRPLRLVMDNAAFHKTELIRQICGTPGVELIYVPPYSPSLNAIEYAWSWISRRVAELLGDISGRCVTQCIEMSILSFSTNPQLCSNYVKHTRRVLQDVVRHQGQLLGDYVTQPEDYLA